MQALITDEYLTHACAIVAQQFIHNEGMPKTPADFRLECQNIMDEHCPVAYQYFTTVRGEDEIPLGTLSIIAGMIVAERPMFMGGTEKFILGVKADA
ncbi:hypothetical protein D3C76_613240 [compost metagenome]